MALSPGTRLGAYEIVSLLGAGGMGEVYRARDSRLGRDIAIKVLPSAVAADADRLARFEQEARATAALNHPNILAVYDIGTADGTTFVVAELLDGETLRDVLAHGAPAMRQAIDYAVQIAHGLAAAHDKGIVHRDLKPENVFVTRDGRVKILDFGLAKLVGPAAGPGVIGGTMMLTTPAGTAAGMIVGTVGYMAPEQVRGLAVDHRADLFAFGAILYELLTGERAFAGESPADTISAILKEDPPQLANAAKVNGPALQRVVQRCLEKKPEQRFHSAHDLAYAIDAAASAAGSGIVAAPLERSAARPRSFRWVAAAATLSALAAFALLAVAVRHWTEVPELRALRLALPLPDGVAWQPGPVPFAVSPDGEAIALALTSGDGVRVWLRRLDTNELRPMAAVEGTGIGNLTWAPDSRSLRYSSGGVFKQLSVDGGTAASVDASSFQNASFAVGPDGGLFVGGNTHPIVRLRGSGGQSDPVTRLLRGENGHVNPAFLADGRRFFFVSMASIPNGLYVGSLDGAEAVRFLPDATAAVDTGDFLLYARDRTILGQRFDSKHLRLIGQPTLLAEDVRMSNALSRRLAFSASSKGFVIAYQTGENASRLTWVDRTGGAPAAIGTPGNMSTLTLSPDGSRVAFSRTDPQTGNSNVWIADLARNVTTRATTGVRESDPTWSPDGNRIGFTTQNDTGKHVMIASAAGGAVSEVRASRSIVSGLDDWSHDGRYLLYHDSPGQMSAFEVSGTGQTIKIAETSVGRPPDEGKFSPDGRAVAFNTEETGRAEVYIKAFPPTGDRWQMSNGGGVQPRWRADGRELYYLALDGTMMAVDIVSGPPTLKAGAPHALFKTRMVPNYGQDQYTVSPDGRRFLVIDPIADDRFVPLRIIVNWPALLK